MKKIFSFFVAKGLNTTPTNRLLCKVAIFVLVALFALPVMAGTIDVLDDSWIVDHHNEWGGSSYNSETKTITFGGGWSGCGWYLAEVSTSDWVSITVEFASAAPHGVLKCEYTNASGGGTDETSSFSGYTSTTLNFNTNKTIEKIYLVLENSGSLTLTSAVVTTSTTTYTVSVTSSNGTVSGTGSFAEGATVTLTPNPNPYYAFLSWSDLTGVSVDGYEDNNPLTFTMPGNAVTVTANFVSSPCTNTKTIQCENTYLTTSTGITVIDGNEAHATPSEIRTASSITTYNGTGYVTLKDASGNGHTGDIFFAFTLSEEADCDITIRYAEANANSYANIFKKVDALTGDISYNGKYYDKISYHRIGGEGNWNWPENFTDWEFTEEDLDATDYILVICNSEGKISLDQITFTASENIFCPNTITMQKSGDDGAAAPTATVEEASVTAAMDGTTVTVTAAAASTGYYFSGWTVLPENAVTFDNPASPTTTFVMPAEDVTITANYEESVSSTFTYTISGSGSITCATTSGSSVVSGTAIPMTAVPSTDYVFTGWTATKGTFSNDATLTTTFTMPAEAATVTATFAQIDNVITVGSETGSATSNHAGATMTESHIDDFGTFEHNVLKLSYSDMTGENYYGWNIGKNDSYSSANSAGATGFGFYYKTETNADKVAFCFDHGDQDHQYKVELPATNNVWKYHYIANNAANRWNGSNIIIYINGKDGDNTTANANGAIYLADIAATSITSKPDINTYQYTNNRGGEMQVNDYGTLCLPMGGTISGATLYSVAGKETGDISYLVLEDQGTNVEAGKPYITQSIATSYTVTMSGAHSAVQDGNGLKGTYELINLTPYDETHHNYFLYENAFKKAGNNVTVGAYRAYLNWDEVSAPAPAPSARRIRMAIEGTEVETGMETVTAMPKTTKVLIDGQLFIIREGKRYTLTGARAQ